MSAEPVGPSFEEGPAWWDHEAGPMVRPYMVTGGRVAGSGLDLVTYVVATASATPPPGPEHQAILNMIQEPQSVVELAAKMDLALGVVRVLLGDLLAAGLAAQYDPPSLDHLPNIETLQAVIHGLRAL